MKPLLLLGGTADGRQLAERLHRRGIKVIYSIAGLVRRPKVSCEVISGGFSQYGGLSVFIQRHQVGAILDVTHPYAQTMSTRAVEAAGECRIPCWRFHRAPWLAQPRDQWQLVNRWEESFSYMVDKRSLLLTAGQLDQDVIDQLHRQSPTQQQLLRTAVAPKALLPDTMAWIKAIGPFSYDDERDLMQSHKIDLLLSKNSGGDATSAKLRAARDLQIPVVMLARPLLPEADQLFTTQDQCEQFILEHQDVF